MGMSQQIQTALKNKNVRVLSRYFFNFDPTRQQQELIRDVFFMRRKRITVSAMTRYGKTQSISIAIGLIILFYKKKKIALIGPQAEQAQILRNYMTELIFSSEDLMELAQIDVQGLDRMRKEASRKRQTFSNGCEYRVFSAEGEANRLMGFGADIVIKDEACLISREAHAKIMRMLGDHPEDSILVELYNPWDRDNIAFEHSTDPAFKHYKVDWRIALEEGRTTQAFIDEQRKELTPLEFQVLYESDFPAESEDSIFNLIRIEEAKKREFDFENELLEIEEILKVPHKHTEPEVARANELIKKFKRLISCDPADQGLDHTVIYSGIKRELKYQQLTTYNEPKSDPMEIVGRMIKIIEDNYNPITKFEVFIDRIGIGTGPLSRLKEVIKEKGWKNVKVIGCHFGEKPVNEDHYRNKKAENYFRLQALFNEGMIKILDKKEITNQLLQMKWKLTSSGKREVVDPDKSPDWCFTGDTLITTDKGDIPIKDIKKGTKVLTPFGFRKVLEKSCRKTNKIIRTETNKGSILKSTPEHKIYTNERFKKVKYLKYTNELENNSLINLIKWRIRNLLSTKEKNIGFREMVDTSIGIFAKKGKETKKHSITEFGKTITNKKFLKDISSIILMEIPSIIRLKILNLWKIKNIEKDTLKKDIKMKNIKKKTENNLKILDQRQKNGINQKKERNGTKNITNNLSQRHQKENIPVKTVKRNLNLPEKKKLDSVQENAQCNIIETKEDTGFMKYVFGVIKNIGKNINFQKEKPVRQDVEHYTEKGINVYNLIVDKDNVYYANNILVSNCDALVFMVWEDHSELAWGFVS